MKSGAVSKVKNSLNGVGKTFGDIRADHPDLTDNQVSMALGYLKRRNLVEIDQVPRIKPFGRKTISSYRAKDAKD
jgi:uncharacterized protein (DUF433 family)